MREIVVAAVAVNFCSPLQNSMLQQTKKAHRGVSEATQKAKHPKVCYWPGKTTSLQIRTVINEVSSGKRSLENPSHPAASLSLSLSLSLCLSLSLALSHTHTREIKGTPTIDPKQ